jgi:peptidoglycan/LPS O-acetylase OafA/YrhL
MIFTCFEGETAVPRITLLLGVILAFLGVFFYEWTDEVSKTALIPTAFGVVFMLLGLLASVEHLRKHMMHGAAALSLLGFVLGVVRLLPGPAEGKEKAFIETAIFAGLCGLLLLLCIKSFIDARRRRTQKVEPPEQITGK